MKKLKLLLVIVWLVIIFLFSSSTGNSSNGLSKGIINKGIIIYEKVTNTDVNNKLIIKKLNYPIRKLAHYSIFFILGILVYLFLLTTNIDNKVLISIFICVFCALLDETHQIYTSGRTPKILDIFIDSFGSISSISILYLKNKKSKIS